VLDRASGPVALLVAVGLVVLTAVLGAAIDAAAGTQGWWISLGSLGLCAAALWLASVATRPPRAAPADPDLDDEEWEDADEEEAVADDGEPASPESRPLVGAREAPQSSAAAGDGQESS
jgi:hypothetical protein